MSEIAQRLLQCRQRIEQTALAVGRSPASVRLLAVSKTNPAEAVRAAAAAGQTCFGENYVQEAVDKIIQLADLKLEWHFIGPIQSNKTRLIAEHFDWVQSVDRLKVAQRLNDQRPAHLNPLNICVQVNISDESQKAGIQVTELPQLIEKIVELPHLRVRGLMAIPAQLDDEQAQRAQFAQLHAVYTDLCQRYDTIDTLSMGMSGDMDAAIAEGSTMLRIGTAIFGARDYARGQ